MVARMVRILLCPSGLIVRTFYHFPCFVYPSCKAKPASVTRNSSPLDNFSDVENKLSPARCALRAYDATNPP